MKPSSGTHILIFPYPAQGHLIPLLDLAHRLLSYPHTTITILVTPKNRPLLDPLLSRHRPTSIAALVLPFPANPSIPPGVENLQHLPPNSFRPVMRALGDLYHPLLLWFESHPSPPTAIISDMFLGWTHHLAVRRRIPRLVFSPSGALALSVIFSLWRHFPQIQGINPSALIQFPEIPNSPSYPWWQLSPIYRSYVEGDALSEFIKDGFLADLASWGLVINSFSELESDYLGHLRELLGHDRVWAVGPLMNDEVERAGPVSVFKSDLLSWLDGCGDREVVYVCFGSQVVLTNQQMEALSLALEESGTRFVWSVKEPTRGHVDGEYGVVPSGFEDRVAGRGLVVKGWVPQVAILSHRVVGAFLTHCGWNSVLEGLVAGVPLLAWPMGADQFANTTLLVEVLKVGRRVCEGAQTVPNSVELARAIAESVGEEWLSEMSRAKDLSRAARKAIARGESSFADLDELVRQLSELNS